MPTFTITAEDDQRRLAVSPGDIVVLRLPENPGTGFRWHAESDPAGGLMPEGDDFEPPNPMQPGAGGIRALSFRARSAGQFRLRAKLWRDWEGDRSVTARFEYPIVVAPA